MLVGIFAGDDTGNIKKSTDGTTWVSAGSIAGEVLCIVGFRGSVLASTGGSIYRSTDGSTWSAVHSQSGMTISSMRVFKGYVYAISTSKTTGTGSRVSIVRSIDGTDWATVWSLSDLPNYAWPLLWTDNSAIYTHVDIKVGGVWTARLLDSADGAAWNEHDTAKNVTRSLSVFGGNYYLGGNGWYWVSGSLGGSWTRVFTTLYGSDVPFGDYMYVYGTNADSGAGGIIRSADLGSWSTVFSGDSGFIRDMVQNGNGDMYATSDLDGVLQSTDGGASWSSVESGAYYSVGVSVIAPGRWTMA